MTSRERHQQILTLKAAGHTGREISEILGIGYSTVYNRLADPTGAKQRARRQRYQRPCPDCGTLMDGSNGHAKSPAHCRSCATHHIEKLWTRDIIIDCIRDYNDQYGHPPSARDWNPGMARKHYRDDISDRFYEDACWPNQTTVNVVFGSWNAAMTAAGFTPLRQGHKYVDSNPYAA